MPAFENPDDIVQPLFNKFNKKVLSKINSVTTEHTPGFLNFRT